MSDQTSMKDLAGTPSVANSVRHTAQISARWCWRGTSGREVMEVEIPGQLAQMIKIHQLQQSGVMRGALVDDAGGIELHILQEGKTAARDYILRAARTLRFIVLGGLRPATTADVERARARLIGMTGGSDIAAAWVRADTGAWVVAITAAEPSPGACAAWCSENGIAYLPPGWSNVWGPRATHPHILCCNQATAAALAERLQALHASGPLVWGSASTTRIARTAPSAPGRAMSLERHAEVGQILAALCASRTHPQAAKSIRDVRRALDEWMRKEHPGESGIYSSNRKAARVINDRAGQMDALARAVSILEEGYRRSKSRDALTRGLRRARARLAVSRAPRAA